MGWVPALTLAAASFSAALALFAAAFSASSALARASRALLG